MKRLIRTATVAMSLDILLKGQLQFLNNHFEVIAVSGDDQHLENIAQREGVKTQSVAMQRAISLIPDVVSLWKLYWLFKKEKPLIVHSITPKAGLLSMIAAYFAGVPVRVHTFTGLIFPSHKGFKQHLLITTDKMLCLAATHIYPEGEGVKADLERYKITSKPLKVIANGNVNGIDVAFFNALNLSEQENNALREKLNIAPTDFVFIFVGRLVGDKGINELIAAFAQLTNYNTKLLLVGSFETELDPLQKNTLVQIDTNANIISVGYQNDVRPYFAISNALAFPSYREGFPNVVLQAGAMGLPSVVTNINGSNEIIIDGQNGVIVPVKNNTELHDAMLKMRSDSDFYSQLQRNARAMIASRYEQQVVWEAILSEYKRLEQNV